MEVQSDTDKVDVLEEGKRNKDGNKEQDNLSDSDFSMASSERSAAMGGNIKFGTPSSPPGCEWWFAPLLQIIKKICPDLPATTVKRMLLTEHLCYGTGVDTFVLQVGHVCKPHPSPGPGTRGYNHSFMFWEMSGQSLC